jgi:hypothetical protein
LCAAAIKARISLPGAELGLSQLLNQPENSFVVMCTGDFVSRVDSEESMRILWTAAKVVIALVIVVPISIIALGLTLGLFGAVIGLAFVALRLAVVGLIAWGLFRIAGRRRCGSSIESSA